MVDMPFNRSTFDETLGQVFAQACRNVEKDGRAHTVIHGLDKRGAVSLMLVETYDDVEPEVVADAAARGVTMFRGPLRDRLPELTELFTRTNTVAAIHVAEAWTAKYRPEELDGPSPSQREDREEIVMTQGAWPAQVYERALIARIVRDTAGKPTTRPYPDDMSEKFSVGWLTWCLPGLPGRTSAPA